MGRNSLIGSGGGRVGVFSRGLLRVPGLQALLGADEVVLNPSSRDAASLRAVAGWGRKPSARRAAVYAERHGLPLLRLEDGFLRSAGLAVAGAPPLSVVIDDVGIYYDTTAPSRLSALLNGPAAGRPDPLDDPQLLARARSCLRRIAEAKLSKYNHAPDPQGRPGRTDLPRRVLVVDQTYGDLSVSCGQATAEDFQRMLRAALEENPDAEILVKIHPDVIAGRKRGYLGQIANGRRLTVLAGDVNPRALIELVDHVYVVTSQLGMEAVLAGKPVTCFGVPFYAGWGLTDDRRPVTHARRARSREQLFAAAYLLYPRYLHPETGALTEIDTVIEHLSLQRRVYAENQGRLFCFGFSRWKQGYVRAYLRAPGNEIHFVRSAAAAKRRGFDGSCRILAWGERRAAQAAALSREFRVPVERMEDGFLRSIGLGSDFTAPASLVLDADGIYYDPSRPSRLERILAEHRFDEPLKARAARLRERIVQVGISKYNVGRPTSLRLERAPGQKVILVPGQVEDDASVRLGGGAVRGNRELLEAVRAANPDAFILFKPHPDVVAGNRRGRVRVRAGERLWDRQELDASLPACLAVADEVHTLTSFVGFEALLRGLPVTTYGMPFYAGWGLTRDMQPLNRPGRGRKLELDELVAGTLILYPRYVHPRSGAFCSPEAVIAYLEEQLSAHGNGPAIRQPWLLRQLKRLKSLYEGVVHAG